MILLVFVSLSLSLTWHAVAGARRAAPVRGDGNISGRFPLAVALARLSCPCLRDLLFLASNNQKQKKREKTAMYEFDILLSSSLEVFLMLNSYVVVVLTSCALTRRPAGEQWHAMQDQGQQRGLLHSNM